MPCRFLVIGYISIPHSYAIVNAYQLYTWIQRFGTDACVLLEPDVPHWRALASQYRETLAFLPESMRASLLALPRWNALCPDLRKAWARGLECVFHITSPIPLMPTRELRALQIPWEIPWVVFCTNETQMLSPQYFSPPGISPSIIPDLIRRNRHWHWVVPSAWNLEPIASYIPLSQRHIVPHGVDQNVFYPHTDIERKRIRNTLGIPTEETIVWLHIGAMTRSKGVRQVLEMFVRCFLSPSSSTPIPARLILKCSDALYGSSRFLQQYIAEVVGNDPLLPSQLRACIHIIPTMLDMQEMNALYNAADWYCAPYSAEGFCLCPLEALAAGTRVMVTQGGAADTYLLPLSNVAPNTIAFLPSTPTMDDTLGTRCVIDIPTACRIWKNANCESVSNEQWNACHTHLQREWTWERIAHRMGDILESVTHASHFRDAGAENPCPQ